MNKRYGFLGIMIAVVVAACDGASPQTVPDNGGEEDKLGELSLNLVGGDSSGRQYRLRSASFSISQYGYPFLPWPGYDAGDAGGFSTTISTETDPDAPVISLRVVEGSYYVALVDDAWYLERFVDGSWTRVEQAVLLSTPYQYAYVYANSWTRVAYRFGVDGELIDFRGGELQVGIEIEQPGDIPDGGGFGGTLGGFGGLIGGFGGTVGGFTGGGLVGGGFVGGPGLDAGVE